MSETQVHVVIHVREGEVIPDLYIHGEGVRVLWVDENSPNDRVYETLERQPDLAFLSELIPEGSETGSSQDSRHEAIKNRILAAEEGRPALTVVPLPTPPTAA